MSFDPALGRFMEEDPAGYIDGPNRYQLELSNPVDKLDPSGTESSGAGVNCGQYAGGPSSQSIANIGARWAIQAGIITPAMLAAWGKTGDIEGAMFKAMGENPYLFFAIVQAQLRGSGLLPPSGQRADPCKYHKIQLYAYKDPTESGGYGYHWIQQHSDGTWSGKSGPTNPQERTTPDDQTAITGGSKWLIGEWWVLGPTVPYTPPPPQPNPYPFYPSPVGPLYY